MGCANGKFLIVAKRYGFETWGIDMDARSVEIAKSILGENIHAKSLEQFVDLIKESRLLSAISEVKDLISTFKRQKSSL